MIFSRRTLTTVCTLGVLGLLAVAARALLDDDAAGLLAAGGMAVTDRYHTTLNPTIGANAVEVSTELPRDYWYAGIELRLAGTLTVAGGATSGTLHDENPMSLIDKIIIEGTGGHKPEVLKNIKGVQAYRLQHALEGIEPGGVTPITSAGVQTATAFNALFYIPFALPGANMTPEMRMRTLLNPREFDVLTLKLTMATNAAFINGGDRTVTVPTAAIEVRPQQVLNVKRLLDGGGAPMRPARYIESHLFREATSAVATERQFTSNIPLGRLYRYLMLRTTNEVTNARQPVDDAIQAVKFRISDTTILRYDNRTQYIEAQRRQVRTRDAVNPSGLNALSDRLNPHTGYYVFDFAKDGRLEGLLDTRPYPAQGTKLDLLHDVATATARQIDVVAGYIVPGAALRAA